MNHYTHPVFEDETQDTCSHLQKQQDREKYRILSQNYHTYNYHTKNMLCFILRWSTSNNMSEKNMYQFLKALQGLTQASRQVFSLRAPTHPVKPMVKVIIPCMEKISHLQPATRCQEHPKYVRTICDSVRRYEIAEVF